MITTQDITEFATTGKVMGFKDALAIFAPRGTRYELHLEVPTGQKIEPINERIEAVVRIAARKIWTVPSGGNWITPIVGTPRIIQGWVKRIEGNQLIVQAGATFIVEVPLENSAIDLARGAIAVGRMVNVVAHPGASIELVSHSALSATPGQPHTGAGQGQT
jgi:hypothetical protein